jgi:hypothetical protein
VVYRGEHVRVSVPARQHSHTGILDDPPPPSSLAQSKSKFHSDSNIIDSVIRFEESSSSTLRRVPNGTAKSNVARFKESKWCVQIITYLWEYRIQTTRVNIR